MLIKLASTQILGILSYCHQTVLSQRTRSLSLLFATGLGLSLVVAACSPTATTTQETTTANTSPPTKSVKLASATKNLLPFSTPSKPKVT